MDFTIALGKRETGQAAALQARVHLLDISLYNCECSGAGPPMQAAEPVQLDAEFDCEVESATSAGLVFAVRLRVACQESLTFHIEATCFVRYAYTGGAKTASKAEIEAFRKSHAVLAVWPYLREFMQNMAARMGFPIEQLPYLRLASR